MSTCSFKGPPGDADVALLDLSLLNLPRWLRG